MPQITALWLAWVEKATRGFDFSCPVDATLNRQVASVETVRAALRISAPRHLLILAALKRRRKQPSVACDSGSRTDAFRFAGRGAGTGVLGRGSASSRPQVSPRRPSIVSPGMEDGAVFDRSDGCFLTDQLGYVDSNKTAVCDITLAFYRPVTATDFIRSASPQTLRGRHCHRLGSTPRGCRASGRVP